MSSLPPPPPPPAGSFAAARWGLGDAFASLGCYVLTAVVIAAVFFAVEGADGVLAGAWLPAFVVLPQTIVLAYVVFVVKRKGRGPIADLSLRFAWMDLPVGIAIAFGAMMAAGLVGAGVAALFGEDQTAAVAELVEESQNGGGITGWIILVAVLGATLVPLSEELLFRGLFWNALTKRGASARTALVVTSLAFAAFHLEPLRAPVLLVLGLALGWARSWAGRVGTSIVAHATINAISFTALLIELR